MTACRAWPSAKGNRSIWRAHRGPRSPRRVPGGDPQGRHIRRRRRARNQVVGIGSADNAAISPSVERCQAEYAARTSHESLGRDRQEVPAGLPVRPPAEAFQRSAHQRRSVIPPHQGQVVTLDVHQPVVVDRCGDGDDHRRLAHGMVEMNPVDLVARSVGAAPVIGAREIPNISRQWRLQTVEASSRRRSCPAPVGVGRFVIRATRERGVGVPSSRSLATASREANSVYEEAPPCCRHKRQFGARYAAAPITDWFNPSTAHHSLCSSEYPSS
ncbi:MAG: hypothetical protein QOJ56_31 [Mycobacterium sp.]|jgi:hypothetical protein|nr:hypothetical protein [Mycobacterium sp.]MDT5351499.1 hypothetical protein [Mycobacterium sp.]MDT7723381.1 hypothetical protein [Mycobacterium sp.]